MSEIDELRGKVDEIDDKILGLIEDRVEVTREIGSVKKNEGKEYYDPAREEKIIERLKSKTKVSKELIESVFKNIIEYCRNEESK